MNAIIPRVSIISMRKGLYLTNELKKGGDLLASIAIKWLALETNEDYYYSYFY